MTLKLEGSTLVRADRQVVWSALHDAELVSRCVPGCQSLVQRSDGRYELVAALPIGPLRWQFKGTIAVAWSKAPSLYALRGEGGGRWGTASGTATITLKPCREGCRVDYRIEAEPRGLFAAAHLCLSDRVGRTLAALFAARFGQIIADAPEQPNLHHA